jgi:ABC-type sugar transport system ATPase subunit
MSAYLEMRASRKPSSYVREVRALKGVDFSVQNGTVHGRLAKTAREKST